MTATNLGIGQRTVLAILARHDGRMTLAQLVEEYGQATLQISGSIPRRIVDTLVLRGLVFRYDTLVRMTPKGWEAHHAAQKQG